MTYPTYQHLLEFITDKRKMHMAHTYQPVMLMTLLQNQGRAKVEEIANNSSSVTNPKSNITRKSPKPCRAVSSGAAKEKDKWE